jgi:hypothetical protein
VPGALPWLVLGAHLVALLLLGHALRPQERGRGTAVARPLWLRLLPEPKRPSPTPPSPAPPSPQEARSHAPAQPRPARDEAAAPQPPALSPTAPAEAITAPHAEVTTAAPTPQLPASAPLDLRLAPTLRQTPAPAAALAREDPRANTQHLNGEDRMAKTLGTDLTLRESVDPDGTRHFRRGGDCVVARPARESQLNPFNQGARPTPRLMEKC